MIIGISEGFHDAAICVLDDNKIVFASHAERHSRKKGDKYLHWYQLSKIRDNRDAIVAYYEKSFSKNLRRLYAGQKWKKPRIRYDVSFRHHESHAAAGHTLIAERLYDEYQKIYL